MDVSLLWPWNWFSISSSNKKEADPDLYKGMKILIRYAEIGVNLDGQIFEGYYEELIGRDNHAVKIVLPSGKTIHIMVTTDEIIGKL